MKYNYIVTKNILDEVIGFVGNDFLEDLLLFIISHFFQLLLDKARAVLIATEFNDVSVYFLYMQMGRKQQEWKMDPHLYSPAFISVRPKIFKQRAASCR